MRHLLADLLSVDMRSTRRAGSRKRVWRTSPAVECLEDRTVLEATTLAAPLAAGDTYLYANYDFNWPEGDPTGYGGAPYYIQIDNEVMEVTAGSPADGDPSDPNPSPDLVQVVRNISASAAGPVAHAAGATITFLGFTYTDTPTLAAPLAGSGLTTSLQITNPPTDVVNGDIYTISVDSEEIIAQANAGNWYILARAAQGTSEAAHDAGAPIVFGLDDQLAPPNLHTAIDASGGSGTTFYMNNTLGADASWTFLVQIDSEKMLIATGNLAGYGWHIVARAVDGTQAQTHGAGSEVLFFGPTTDTGGQTGGGGQGGGGGQTGGGGQGEPTVEFADSTIKLFVSGKSGGQTTTVTSAQAGTVQAQAFVSMKPAAKKGGKKTTNVSIDVIIDTAVQSDATPVQVAYAVNDALTTATPGKNFTGPTSGTITFQPGEFVKSFTIQVLTAKLKQAQETIVYHITSLVGAALGTNSTTTVDVVDAALGENEMKRLLKAQLKIQNELHADLKGSITPSKSKRIVHLVAIDAALKDSADGYAPIYTGDNVFDALYLQFASRQLEIINIVNTLEASDASTADATVDR